MIKKIENYFIITGKTYSYIMDINDCNELEHVYYGKKIDENIEYFNYIKSTFSPNPKNRNYKNNEILTLQEYTQFGKGDYNSPSFIIKRSDGVFSSHLKYVSYEVLNGSKELEIMPSVRNCDETLIIKLHDIISEMDVLLYYIVVDSSDCLTRYTKFINNTNETLYLDKAMSFSFDLYKNDYKLLKLPGTWAEERRIEITEIPTGNMRIESKRGTSSHQMNPFIALMDKDSCDNTGDVYSISLIYSGSFLLSVEKNENNSIRVMGGINDFLFSYKINQNEEFITPEAVLTYSSKGLDNISLELSDFYREHLINPKHVYKDRPIVINNWEATYFDFDNEKLKEIIDNSSVLGIDTFVLDDGWFKNRNNDLTSLGDWEVDYNKLKNGLEEISLYLESKNMKFGLWFEPEMVSKDSELFKKHPEYAIKIPNIEPKESRNQYVLDFTNDKVIDYIFNVIDKVLSKINLSYMKWDMNRYLTDIYSYNLDFDTMGEFYHRYTLGVYKLYNKVLSKYPDLLIEGCSSGGGRFDAGILYYSPQIWASDDTDCYMRTLVNYSTSICYPVSTISSHVSVCPNHQLNRNSPFESRINIASFTPTGFELDPSKLSDIEKELSKKHVIHYKEISELVIKGDFYRLMNPYETEFFGAMLVSKDKLKGYIVGQNNRRMPVEKITIFKLKGLNENYKYKIDELNIIASGKSLMEFGVLVPWIKEDYSSFTYHIYKVD